MGAARAASGPLTGTAAARVVTRTARAYDLGAEATARPGTRRCLTSFGKSVREPATARHGRAAQHHQGVRDGPDRTDARSCSRTPRTLVQRCGSRRRPAAPA